MAHSSYRQFCPVAMAAEILCRRWMMLVIRELVAGTTRFNDLRRGVLPFLVDGSEVPEELTQFYRGPAKGSYVKE